jgi:hypothetical protein
MTAVQANAADWLTAIGTVGAVFIALLLAGGPALWQWWRRPRLELVLGATEPHVQLEHEGSDITAAFLRIEVTNSGHLAARRVRGQVRRWWAHTNGGRYDWVQHDDIDPVTLHWVSIPRAGPGELSLPPEVDIAPRMSNFLNVSRFDTHAARTWLYGHDPRLTGSHFQSHYPIGEHRAEIVVSAENASLVTRVVSYTTSHDRYFTDIRFAEPPEANGVQRLGLLNLLGTNEAE